MKLLASGDHHFDEHKRFDECVRVHRFIAEEVARQKPAVFCSGGDIYESASTPTERAAVADFLTAVADTCPVVIARGNHDKSRDCELLARLKSRHPILVEERAAVHIVNGIAIAAVAWPSRASLAAMLGKAVSSDAIDQVAQDALRDVLRGLRGRLAEHHGPRVLLGHFMVDGSVTSVGQPLVGAELNIGIADLALADVDATVMAHIHASQMWEHDGAPILYTGSPYRTAFGETEEKSIAWLEFGGEDGDLVDWGRIPTPATKMEMFEAAWAPDERSLHGLAITSKEFPSAERVRGAECRVRCTVPRDARDAARAGADALRTRMLADGAVSVKVEEVVIATTRARAPEIARATTLGEKLSVVWDRNAVPTDRRERLLAKLAELETVQ